MHYSVLVIAPPKTADIEGYVAAALKPFNENDEKPHDCGWEKENTDAGCEFCRANSKWDWYVIGGRWAGLLGGVRPEKDRRNYERCRLCGGTGTRRDMASPIRLDRNDPYIAEIRGYYAYPQIGEGCNGCYATGWALKHPPYFVVPEDSNVRPVADIPENVATYGVLTPEGAWVERRISAKYDEMPDEQWRVEWSKVVSRYAPDHLAIVVDIHS